MNKLLFNIIEVIKRKLFGFEDYLYEKRHSFDFGGIILQKNLVAENKESLMSATAYHAVWCYNVRKLISEAHKEGHCFENFIDIGSGKGKACFFAKSRHLFKNIIGVEFSKPLVEIANRNKEKVTSDNIFFLNIDAVDYKLPSQSNLVFLFNPFDNLILEKFILNNLDNFKIYKSIIAYANDLERASLFKLGFQTIFRDQTRKISLHKLL